MEAEARKEANDAETLRITRQELKDAQAVQEAFSRLQTFLEDGGGVIEVNGGELVARKEGCHGRSPGHS